jgi:predicted Zn-dependent peptidase
MGNKPELKEPRSFTPPVARVASVAPFAAAWLLERHTLPLVSVRLVVPAGSAADPPGKAGLAALTAEMMEQGSGKRGSLEIARAVEELGASLETWTTRDASGARLDVTKDQLGPALAILAEVAGKPRFEASEWKRVKSLWIGDLKNRAADADAVAQQAAAAVIFGAEHPYGHLPEGTLREVESLSLEDVKKFHAAQWRPDRATLVVAGDLGADELQTLVPSAFSDWKPGKGTAPAAVQPGPPLAPAPRLVVVDRPGSAQTALRVLWHGPPAADRGQPALELVNIPLGGSFTSRLNQNLRETHGWTYGARSSVPFLRGPGALSAGASVQTEVTGPALGELLKELAGIAASGPSELELDKARAQARTDDMGIWETAAGAADRLATLAGAGLGPQRDSVASVAREAMGLEETQRAAAAFEPGTATILAVGDLAAIREQLAALGLPEPELRDVEGRALAGAGTAPQAR